MLSNSLETGPKSSEILEALRQNDVEVQDLMDQMKRILSECRRRRDSK